MKFRSGAWLWEDGVTPFCMKRVYGFRVEPGALVLWADDRTGARTSDRFEGTVLEVRVTSPMADVIRVRVSHHRPASARPAGFDLDYAMEAGAVSVDDAGADLVFTSGRLTLRAPKSGPWGFRIEDPAGEVVAAAGEESLGHMRVRDRGDHLVQRLSLGVDECIYGLGERFGPLVKNGQNVVIWNMDGGTCSDQAYKNVPFYLSSRGYGLLVNSPGKVDFEIGTERVSQVQFSVQDEALDYYVFYGPDPKAVLEKYTRLAGRPAMPPAWSFGLWLSTSFTTKYDEATVGEFVDGMAARGIPLSVLHFDCFWMRERQWCDFEWDQRAFPDPQGMIRRLKEKGLRVCVWINPYVSQLSKLFAEGRDNGYFLKRGDGSVYQVDGWQPGMAFVDFTNPPAVAWYQSKLKALLDMGVDAFKTDFGERIPADAVYHDGSDGRRMHNYYAYLYNQAVFELLERHHGKGNAIVFARAATCGSQKFPVHWGGDCDATFAAMAEDLRGGLSFCMSGAAFWSHDIGGFNGTADPAVYKRWVAFGLLSTHSRLHGDSSYRVPWLFDEESVDVLRHFARLKNRLTPYLLAAARDAAEHGWPVMRAMVVEFPNDPACRYLDRQYMLGDALLVAPVFRADSIAEYYLPEGVWTDVAGNASIDGGRWRRERVNFLTLPLYARANSILPMRDDGDRPQWTADDPLTLHLIEIADGGDVIARAAPSDGGKAATFRCLRCGHRLTLAGNGVARNVRVVLRFREFPQAAVETSLVWQDPDRPLVIDLAPHAGNGKSSPRNRSAAAAIP